MENKDIALLKSNVVKPGSELHSKLESRLTVTDMRFIMKMRKLLFMAKVKK